MGLAERGPIFLETTVSTEKRVALITGGGKENGIGTATALRLAKDGFIIAASDVAAAGVANDRTAAGQ